MSAQWAFVAVRMFRWFLKTFCVVKAGCSQDCMSVRVQSGASDLTSVISSHLTSSIDSAALSEMTYKKNQFYRRLIDINKSEVPNPMSSTL